MGYAFEWDAAKAAANVRRHGVTFEEAVTSFGDPLCVFMPDPDHAVGEQRFLVLGLSIRGRLLVVAFGDRPPRTRLISARLATRHELRRYEEDEG